MKRAGQVNTWAPFTATGEQHECIAEPEGQLEERADAHNNHAGGVEYAYRELGTNNPGTPVVFLIQLVAVLDNCRTPTSGRCRERMTSRYEARRRERGPLFGSKVVMQQRLVDTSLIGDVLLPRTVDAAPHKHGVGGVEDAGLGVGGGLSRRFNHMVNMAMAVPAIKSPSSLGFVRSRCVRLQRATASRQDPRHFGGGTPRHQTEDGGN